jgi:hypothetical protein
MPVRCNYCHQTFNLSPDYIAQVLPKALEKKHKYHVVDCINCRKQIKVPVDQMERFAVPPASEEEATVTES